MRAWGSTSTPATRPPLPLTRWRCSIKSSTAWSASTPPTRPCAVSCGMSCWAPGSRHTRHCLAAWRGRAGTAGSAWRKRPSRGEPGSRPRPALSDRHGRKPNARSVPQQASRTHGGMMTQRVVCLHTVLSVAAQFGELTREILPDSVQVWHTVDEMLAKVAVAQGELSPFIYRRVAEHVRAAEEAGADVVQFTCSSISPCAEVAPGARQDTRAESGRPDGRSRPRRWPAHRGGSHRGHCARPRGCPGPGPRPGAANRLPSMPCCARAPMPT